MTRLQRWLLTSLAFSAAVVSGCASNRTPARTAEVLTDERREAYVQSFDEVWTTIKNRHWDPTLNGADWDGAKAELRPRVENARTATDARAAMTELVSRLNQSHFGIIPADVYTREDAAAANADAAGDSQTADAASASAADTDRSDGSTGIQPRLIGDDAVVFRVEPGSAAEAAGVKPGWIIRSVGRVNVRDRIAALRAATEDVGSSGLIVLQLLDFVLAGPVGSEKNITFLDADDREVPLTLTLGQQAGSPAAFGNLVGVRLDFKSSRPDPAVGYVAFNIFIDPPSLMPKFAQSIESFRDTRGMIIDLRGNPGGIGAMAIGMGGWFVTERNLSLGTMTTREASLNFVLNPRPKPYTQPLAILIDDASASTSEILAGGLKDLGRARVFGTTSAGAALPSVIARLPSGDGFQYAFANYISAGGKPLEGLGVTPDEVVELDRAALLQGRDPQLDAAIRWILDQPAQTASR